jgi:hypothetical protein
MDKLLEIDKNFNYKQFLEVERNFSIFLRQRDPNYEKNIEFDLSYNNNTEKYIIRLHSVKLSQNSAFYFMSKYNDEENNKIHKFCLNNKIEEIVL